jgi:hypothetical protein
MPLVALKIFTTLAVLEGGLDGLPGMYVLRKGAFADSSLSI